MGEVLEMGSPVEGAMPLLLIAACDLPHSGIQIQSVAGSYRLSDQRPQHRAVIY